MSTTDGSGASGAHATIDTFDLALPHGITLSCRAAGPLGAPTIVFLHGFPEAAFVWDEVMAALGGRYRCVAPNLRGYERSSAPKEVEAYRAKLLVSDVVALIEQLGAPVDLLVAHDWGGAIAWNVAGQRPELMRRLLMINSPHPVTFLRDLQHDPAQQRASAYMSFLIRPDAETLLAENDYARMLGFLTGMGNPGAWLTDDVKRQYRAVWDAGLTGALNYYRASPLKPPASASPDDPVMKQTLPEGFGLIRVPTKVLWGQADVALPPHLLEGLEPYLSDGEIIRVPGASHWIVHERPALVVELIQRWLA